MEAGGVSRVIVTGANGFVGKHLLQELLINGYEIVAIGGSEVPSLDQTAGVQYMTLDLTDPAEAGKIDFNGVSGVFHLAGLAAVGPSFDDPQLYMNVNVGIEINLFETSVKQNSKPRFLIISSGTLYDAKAALPLTESSKVNPSSSPYAASKLAQEEKALEYAKRGFEVIIARPFNHIGPGQGPGFIVPDITQQIIKVERGETNEILVGNLDAKRDYTDVRDIVRAYRLLFEKGKSGEIYNICSGTARSGHEILDGLLAASGTKAEVKQDPAKMRPSDTPEVYGSHDKLAADTGWQPKIDLESTLKDVITDWRQR